MLSSNRTSRWLSIILAFALVAASFASLTTRPAKSEAAPVNLVVNPGYEDAANVWTDWTYEGTASSLTTGSGTGNVRSGSQSINFYNADAYTVSFTQTLTDLLDGEYVLKAWASGANQGSETISLFADNYGGDKLTAAIANDGWNSWHQYTVSGIQVVGGQVRIGFEVDAPGGVWGYFDDFEFYQVEEEQEETPPAPWDPSEFVKGADISTLPQIEDAGGKYYDNGAERDLLDILKDRGVNYIRLRIWNDPVQAGGYNDKPHTVALAKRVKEAGFKLLLDFHYSDFWADPGQQVKPAAWASLSFDDLKTAVYDYTADVLNALEAEDAYPDMVQIGNEINPGMLLPDGSTSNYNQLAQLLSAGISAVRDTTPVGQNTKTMIHLAEGGKNGVFRSFFDALTSRNVDFDVIGLSFYPYWHGTYNDLKLNLDDLSARYNKPLIVVETAHPQTLEDGDGWANIASAADARKAGFPATPQGQYDQFTLMLNTVAHTAGGMGAGVFYWEPAWIPVPKDGEGNYQAGWKINEGNAWDNQAMFDVHGNALLSLDAYRFDATQLPAKAAIQAVEPDGVTIWANASVDELSAMLPDSVGVLYNEGSVEQASVVWEAVDEDRLSRIGTFTVNGTVTGTALATKVDVTVTSYRNLAANPGFEEATTPVGWTVTGTTAATKIESSNAYSGSRAFNYWLATDYSFELKQTITGLPDGYYTLRARTVGEGGETTLRLFADGYGGDRLTTPNIVNTVWDAYGTYAIEHIHVTSGQATIGFEVSAPGNTWGRFDEVEFFREVAVPAWTPQASVTATERTTSSVKLTWSGISEAVPAAAYKLYLDGRPHASVTAATYTVTGLEAGHSYAFKIEASADAEIWTSDGPSVTASTLTDSPQGPIATIPPIQPGVQTVPPDALTSPDADGKAQIQVTAGTTEVRLPANAAELLGAGRSLVLSDGAIEMEVPASILAELAKLTQESGGHLAITVAPRAASTELLAKAKQAAGADITPIGAVYDLGLAYVSPSGERKALSEFGEPVTLAFPVDESFDPKRAGIFYIAEDGKLSYIGGKLADGVFTAKTSHFSAYAILQVNRAFTDVSASHWAADYIVSLSSKLIVSGTGEGRFEPNRAVTRAELATMLSRALRLTASSEPTPFEDVPKTASYAEAINAVYAHGIAIGTGDGSRFEPNRTITRQEMAVMLLRAYDVLLPNTGAQPQQDAASFADASRIAPWARQAIGRLAALGLLQGRSGNLFAPEQPLTRAEAAKIVDALEKLQ